jgi:pantetheine-phosphate adenylyltransferase
MRIAVFPGSFDPVTIGHESIVLRATSLFDKVVIAIGDNAQKSTMFSVEVRRQWLELVFMEVPKVEVTVYYGLTVDFCRDLGASFILRGLRTSADFEFERSIGQINKKLDDSIETVFLLTKPDHSALNSSIVRDLVRFKGDIRSFIPDALQPEWLINEFNKGRVG